MNPTFSNAKLKELFPLLKLCSDRLHATIQKNLGAEIDFTECIGRLTMDAVFNCLFGVETDLQNDTNNVYLSKVRAIVKQSAQLTPLFRIMGKLF
jgi:cytochrome P450